MVTGAYRNRFTGMISIVYLVLLRSSVPGIYVVQVLVVTTGTGAWKSKFAILAYQRVYEVLVVDYVPSLRGTTLTKPPK